MGENVIAVMAQVVPVFDVRSFGLKEFLQFAYISRVGLWRMEVVAFFKVANRESPTGIPGERREEHR
jgi:hypothetical protein